MNMRMRWRRNRCRERRENLCLLACGVLPEAERAALEAHLAGCAECRRYYEEVAGLSGQLRHWAVAEPRVEANPVFQARWTRLIRTERSPTRSVLATRMAGWREWLWPSPVAWGTLAAVWVFILCLQMGTPTPIASGSQVVASRPSVVQVRLLERQRELSLLLESLAPSTPSKPETPQPRSQRQVHHVPA